MNKAAPHYKRSAWRLQITRMERQRTAFSNLEADILPIESRCVQLRRGCRNRRSEVNAIKGAKGPLNLEIDLGSWDDLSTHNDLEWHKLKFHMGTAWWLVIYQAAELKAPGRFLSDGLFIRPPAGSPFSRSGFGDDVMPGGNATLMAKVEELGPHPNPYRSS